MGEKHQYDVFLEYDKQDILRQWPVNAYNLAHAIHETLNLCMFYKDIDDIHAVEIEPQEWELTNIQT